MPQLELNPTGQEVLSEELRLKLSATLVSSNAVISPDVIGDISKVGSPIGMYDGTTYLAGLHDGRDVLISEWHPKRMPSEGTAWVDEVRTPRGDAPDPVYTLRGLFVQRNRNFIKDREGFTINILNGAKAFNDTLMRLGRTPGVDSFRYANSPAVAAKIDESVYAPSIAKDLTVYLATVDKGYIRHDRNIVDHPISVWAAEPEFVWEVKASAKEITDSGDAAKMDLFADGFDNLRRIPQAVVQEADQAMRNADITGDVETEVAKVIKAISNVHMLRSSAFEGQPEINEATAFNRSPIGILTNLGLIKPGMSDKAKEQTVTRVAAQYATGGLGMLIKAEELIGEISPHKLAQHKEFLQVLHIRLKEREQRESSRGRVRAAILHLARKF